MEHYKRIVLNIPHSSTVIPRNTWIGDIEAEIDRWTDWYTDVIFTPMEEDRQITPVVFPYSRFYCDVERLPENEPMEAIGQGIFYTLFNGCVRRKTNELASHVSSLHQNHLSELSSNITCDETLLIDCHSFPEEIAEDVDICLGWNEDSSKPSDILIGQIKAYFENLGYRVACNYPYSNSITPPSEFKYQSIMIELNKHLYLTNGAKNQMAINELRRLLQNLYTSILHTWWYMP